MRLILICIISLFSTVLTANDGVFKIPVTINFQNEELWKVLEAIENKADIYFAYKIGTIDPSQRVRINVVRTPLENILQILFYNDNIRYVAIGKQVVLFKNQTSPKNAPPVRDTIWTRVVDTTIVSIKTHVQIIDTVQVFDTIMISKSKTLSRKKYVKPKTGFINLAYISDFAPLKFKNPPTSMLTLGKGAEWHNGLNINVGKTSNNWELSSGLGFCMVNQNIAYKFKTYNTQTIIDSVPDYKVFYDSSYIAIPMVDTLWLVKQNISIIYKKSVRDVTDSLVENFKTNNKLYYLTIPINISYRKEFRNSNALMFSLSTCSYILLSGNYTQPSYKADSHNETAHITPNPVYVVSKLSGGLDWSLTSSSFLNIMPGIGFVLSPKFANSEYLNRNYIHISLNIAYRKYF